MDRVSFIDGATRAADRAASFYQALVLRPLSVPLSRAAAAAGVTPNAATAAAAIIGLAAAAIAGVGTHAALICGMLIWHLSRVFDLVDGNLARASRSKTWSGKFLDGLSDMLLDGVMLIAMGAASGGPALTASLAAAWLQLAGGFSRQRFHYVLSLSGPGAVPPLPAKGVVRTRSLPHLLLDGVSRLEREIALPGLLVAAVLNRPDLWVWLVAGLRAFTGLATLAGSVYSSRALHIVRP